MASGNVQSRMRYAMGQESAGNEVLSLLGGTTQVGQVYYHDPISGKDSNAGDASDHAKVTLQAAINLTEANRGDLIIRMRGYDQPDATVNFNVFGITVIAENFGMSTHAQGEYFTTDTSNTDGPAARITQACHLVGLGFAGVQSSGDDVTSACVVDGIASSTDGYGTWLQGCRFVNWNRDDVNYGLFLRGPAGVLVDNCAFVGEADYALVGGIAIGRSTAGSGRETTNMEIRDCTFQRCTYAIEQLSQSGNTLRHALIRHNFVIDGGKFLNHNTIAGNSGVLVADNYLSTGVDTGSFDENLSVLESDGIIFAGNHYKSDLQQV